MPSAWRRLISRGRALPLSFSSCSISSTCVGCRQRPPRARAFLRAAATPFLAVAHRSEQPAGSPVAESTRTRSAAAARAAFATSGWMGAGQVGYLRA